MKYYRIYVSADGLYIDEFEKEELEKALREDGCGRDHVHFLDKIPDESNPNYWDSNDKHVAMLIIKGEIVVPRAVKIVEEYEL